MRQLTIVLALGIILCSSYERCSAQRKGNSCHGQSQEFSAYWKEDRVVKDLRKCAGELNRKLKSMESYNRNLIRKNNCTRLFRACPKCPKCHDVTTNLTTYLDLFEKGNSALSKSKYFRSEETNRLITQTTTHIKDALSGYSCSVGNNDTSAASNVKCTVNFNTRSDVIVQYLAMFSDQLLAFLTGLEKGCNKYRDPYLSSRQKKRAPNSTRPKGTPITVSPKGTSNSTSPKATPNSVTPKRTANTANPKSKSKLDVNATKGSGTTRDKSKGKRQKNGGLNIKGDVNTTKSEGKMTKSDVNTTKSEGKMTKSDVNTTKSEGKMTKSDVNTIKSEGKMTKSDVNTIKSEGKMTKSDVNTIKSDVNTTKSEGKIIKSVHVTLSPKGRKFTKNTTVTIN